MHLNFKADASSAKDRAIFSFRPSMPAADFGVVLMINGLMSYSLMVNRAVIMILVRVVLRTLFLVMMLLVRFY